MSRARSPDGSLLGRDGSLDPRRVRAAAAPTLDLWHGTTLARVKRRLQGLVGASLAVLAIRVFLDPGGLTGTLITVWSLLALPIATIAGAVLVLLRNPANAPSVWWSRAPVATLGLISVAGATRASRSSAIGRAGYELLFGADSDGYTFETETTTVDLSVVARIRQYVWYAIVGSAGLIVLDQALRPSALTAAIEWLIGADPGPGAWAALGVGAVLFGAVLGSVLAAAEVGR